MSLKTVEQSEQIPRSFQHIVSGQELSRETVETQRVDEQGRVGAADVDAVLLHQLQNLAQQQGQAHRHFAGIIMAFISSGGGTTTA